jgi:hypothetical protein
VSRFALLLGAGWFLACVGSVASAAEPRETQPNSLLFGTLPVDGTAEGSFMIFAPADEPKPNIKVDAPKFVKVLDTGTHFQEFGMGNGYTCVTVEVAIDTAKAGEFSGEIAVTVGDTVTKVPVTATVKARKPGAPRVLVVGTPFERYATNDGKHFKGWTDVVDSAGLEVSYLLVREKKAVTRDLDLSKFDSVLMSGEALYGATDDDVKRVRAYAEAGGRVLVTANAFLVGSVKGANVILDGYGLEIKDFEAPGIGKELVLDKDHFSADVVKAGVQKAKFFRASPVKTDKGARVLVTSPEFEDKAFGYAAVGKAGKGEVVALGESLWWNWVSEKRAKDSDNGKLLAHLLAPQRTK